MSGKALRVFLVSSLVAASSYAAMVESSSTAISGAGPTVLLYEDTSAANTQLVLTTTAKAYSRSLRSVSVVCSSSATVTVTLSFTRAKSVSGTVSVSLPNVPITAATSGALYADLVMSAADVLVVTVPAAGAGVTCTAQVVEVSK